MLKILITLLVFERVRWAFLKTNLQQQEATVFGAHAVQGHSRKTSYLFGCWHEEEEKEDAEGHVRVGGYRTCPVAETELTSESEEKEESKESGICSSKEVREGEEQEKEEEEEEEKKGDGKAGSSWDEASPEGARVTGWGQNN